MPSIVTRESPRRTRRALLAIALAALWPAVAPAQPPLEDFDPPEVQISPAGATFTTASQQITVFWCDYSPLEQTSAVIKLNGTVVTGQFTYMNDNDPQCNYSKKSVGTVTLAVGTNTITAEIRDANWNLGADTATMGYTPPPKDHLLLLDVTPDLQDIELEPGASHAQQFRISNPGTASQSVTLTKSCTGSAIASGCATSSETVSIGAGASINRTYSLVASGSAGASGTIKLVVANGGVKDSGVAELATTWAAGGGVGTYGLNPETALERELCLTIAAGAGAAYECGDLRLAHALPGVQTMGKARTPTLVYNSNHAHPVLRIAADITVPDDIMQYDSARVTFMLGATKSQVTYYSPSQLPQGRTRRLVWAVDSLAIPTGAHTYEVSLEVFPITFMSEPLLGGGEIIVVNRSQSPFGAGWWLAGLEELVSISGSRKLWIGGDGSARVFSPAGMNLWTTPNLDRVETLEYDPATATYCRRLPQRGCVLFDTAGKHIETRNQLGASSYAHRTHFTWASGLLASIGLPVVGDTLEYSFAYTGGKLDSVIAPPIGTTARVTQVTVDGARLTSVEDPDLTQVQFAYDTTFANRATSRTNRRGHATAFSYGAANTLVQVTVPLDATTSATTTFEPGEIKGLTSAGPVVPQQVLTKVDGPRSDVGDTTLFWLALGGAPRKIRDAVGNDVVLLRGDGNFAALVTEVRYPSGRVVQATYDARGNIATSTEVNPYGDAVNAVTSYQWDGTFDLPTRITPPLDSATTFGYNATTGLKEWERPGNDAARQVSFFYNDLYLLRAVEAPAAANHGAPRDSIHYDSLGNVRFVQTPLGFRSWSYRDAIGRDTLLKTPIDAAQNAFTWQRVMYDIADQDTLVITWGDGSTDTLKVRTRFDAEGNADSVSTMSVPDRASIGWTKRAFTFDRANRQTEEKLVGGPTFTWRYDVAGNQTNGGRQGGDNVTITYDVLGRPTRRLTGDANAIYAYDAAGNLLSAANANARVKRSYHLNGALATDSLRLSTFYPADTNFSQHVYGLRFRYDLQGRRTVLRHPGTLSADSIRYEYDARTGALAALVDPAGQRHAWHYDALGRVTRHTRLAGQADSVYETLTYDRDSRLVRRSVINSVETLMSDSLLYDGRGKVVKVMGSGDSLEYAPLGPLVASRLVTANSNEDFVLDALANRISRTVFGNEDPGTDHYEYAAGTGQLLRRFRFAGTFTDTVKYQYDAAGNTIVERAKRHVGSYGTQSVHVITWRTYGYNLENRMRDTELEMDSVLNAGSPELGGGGPDDPFPNAQTYRMKEKYRYDPLGRRVLTQVVHSSNCADHSQASGCRNTVTRAVWDGDQLLWEIRAPDSSDVDKYSDAHHGQVNYTHGPGIDAPVALQKGSQLVLPWINWRGVYVLGTCSALRCAVSASNAPWFPLGQEGVFGGPGVHVNGPPSWYGSLITGQSDGSGLQYRRNRYYDPATGRFTQVDPSGLLGGLNTYGFANGDPVSYADPYGLASCNIGDYWCELAKAGLDALGMVTGSVVGGGVGFVAGAGCGGVGAVFCSPVFAAAGATAGAVAGRAAAQQVHDRFFADAGKGRGGNRNPNREVERIVKKYDLNRDGQRALHDQISGKDLSLDDIDDIAADLAGQEKYRNPPRQ